jgi:hypothetical protein
MLDRSGLLRGLGLRENNPATRPENTETLGEPRVVCNRGARIRTGDLTDPNGARYQAAPRPE